MIPATDRVRWNQANWLRLWLGAQCFRIIAANIRSAARGLQ